MLQRAKTSPFRPWVEQGNFTADREPIDFATWRYLGQIYDEIPADLIGFEGVIKKSAQGGASILALLLSLFIGLRYRAQLAYFLPTFKKAYSFSANRFIRLVRENAAIYRLMGDPGTPHRRQVVDEGSVSTRRLLYSIINFTSLAGKVSTESDPLDALMFDEVQEMTDAEIEKAMARINASPLMIMFMVSTANFVGADIDRQFNLSDQRMFHTRCRCAEGVILGEAWHPRTGPLCIGKGNGTTPGVPEEFFYYCPRCSKVITDPQDGRFIPRNPGPKRRGWHFPLMLSPRQSAARIWRKWVERIDTKNFYNRSLGLAYTDPDTQPVTEAHLTAAQNGDLQWGPPVKRLVDDGIFMGIDQMGHDNHVVIKARADGKQRLLHLEIIQADDPWKRSAELMEQYRVRFCAVEALPNFNEAHRFAKAFHGKVFLVEYQDLDQAVLRWADRFNEAEPDRKTDEEFKTEFTVKVDQYKMMSIALSRWPRGEVETPDARTLYQLLRTDEGERPVAVCNDPKLGFWLHLQRVALVTELGEGKKRQAERKLRRAVRKVGIDPHFAYSWMLSDVAWAREYGTTFFLTDEPPSREVRAKATSAPPPSSANVMEQLRGRLPEVFVRTTMTCADCTNFDPDRGFCTERGLYTDAPAGACDIFVPTGDDE